MTQPNTPATPAPSATSDGPGKPVDEPQPQPEPGPQPGTTVATTEEPAPKDTKDDKLAQELWGSAQTFEERQMAFQLASRVRQSAMVRKAAEAMASFTEWGAKANPILRASLARYALECGTDPMRHWYILGNSFYDRAELYIDALAADPEFIRPEITLIHADERADPEEAAKRRALRVKWGAPENSPGIALVKLHFNNGRGPFEGCNWVKVGTTSNGKQKDPVGSEHPTQTAITRAYRKAGKQCKPVWFMKHVLPILKKAKELAPASIEGEERSTLASVTREEPHPVALPDPTAKVPEVRTGKPPEAEAVESQPAAEKSNELDLDL